VQVNAHYEYQGARDCQRNSDKPNLKSSHATQYSRSAAVKYVDPGEKESLLFEVVQRQGRSANQNNVTLEEGEL
jgi:hypothetical protein